MVLEVGDHAQQAGGLVGVRAVVGSEAVEELHQAGVLERGLMDVVHTTEKVQSRDFEHGVGHLGVQPGAELVQALFQEGAAGELVLVGRGGHKVAHRLFGHVEGGGGLSDQLLRIGGGGKLRTVGPPVAAHFG